MCADLQPLCAQNEVSVPVLRTPSKLVKKRDASRNGSRKDLVAPNTPAPIAEAITQAPDVPSRPDTPSSTHVSASVNSHTAEHVIIPPHPPTTPTPKHNVLVKKNSVKRAAAKPIVPEEPVPESGSADVANNAAVPETAVEERDFADTAEPDISNEDESSDDEGTDDEISIHATAPPTLGAEPESPVHSHPFPTRGTTPPSGTRFIEGADGSLEPTESRTTGTTAPPQRPGRPTRRISLRSFGFFYGKDSRPTSTPLFPAYVPPADHVVYEVGDESEPEVEVEAGHIQRPAATHKRNSSRLSLGLLGQRKVSTPKATKVDKRAVESALSLRTLIIGPAALDVKVRNTDKGRKSNDPKTSSAAALRRVNHQLLVPSEANRVIAALRELPPPDLPPATAETVETIRRKKGWVFGRGHTKGERGKEREKTKEGAGMVAMPIHGCCLDLTDEEAEQKHFSKLTGSAVGAQSSTTAQANANIGSADLSSLIPMLKNMRLVNLQASPDVSSMNAASLGAHLSAPDLGFGQSADKDGPLAGSVPSVGSLVDGMEKVGQTLMSLGFATTTAVLPSHVGVHPPKDRMSVLTCKSSALAEALLLLTKSSVDWWGYEVVFPPPTMHYLGKVSSISGALLNFLSAFALFSNGVREMLPFVRYIAQFIEFEWKAIKSQDKGRGVVCAATW